MRWEYRTLKLPANRGFLGGRFDQTQLDTQLLELGREGWELVTAFSTQEGYGSSRDIVVIFKRQS